MTWIKLEKAIATLNKDLLGCLAPGASDGELRSFEAAIGRVLGVPACADSVVRATSVIVAHSTYVLIVFIWVANRATPVPTGFVNKISRI